MRQRHRSGPTGSGNPHAHDGCVMPAIPLHSGVLSAEIARNHIKSPESAGLNNANSYNRAESRIDDDMTRLCRRFPIQHPPSRLRRPHLTPLPSPWFDPHSDATHRIAWRSDGQSHGSCMPQSIVGAYKILPSDPFSTERQDYSPVRRTWDLRLSKILPTVSFADSPLSKRLRRLHQQWIIPACAGRTRSPSNPHPVSSDHPRACGANPIVTTKYLCESGSSPRVRGELSPPATCFRNADHPRVCGANKVWGDRGVWGTGSSPRVRGEPVPACHQRGAGRIIPVCAGRTASTGWSGACTSDHPRVCGANLLPFETPADTSGSSPRVRGEHRNPSPQEQRRRIIPACAGRTLFQASALGNRPDHPRVCGANQSGATVLAIGFGSSPRVRGELNGVPNGRHELRIIPACAGRT